MKTDLKTITNKFRPFLASLKKYLSFGFVVGFLIIYSFLVLRINLLMRSEPSQTDYDARLKTVQRPKIDNNAVDKIQSLQDQNIQVQVLFKQARDNPFS